jgi:hypothetical protein
MIFTWLQRASQTSRPAARATGRPRTARRSVQLVLERLEDRLVPVLPTAFNGLTASQTITYGTSSVLLSGVVVAPLLQVPAGESVFITIGNQVTTATTVAGGNFQVNVPTSTLPVSVYTIKYTYPGDAVFNATSDSSTTLTVINAQPTFSSLTASQTITYGTSAVVSGVLNAGASVPVPAGESVSIAVGNSGQVTTATTGSGGSFQANLPTSALAVSASAYAIKYTYLGDSNFNSTSDTSTTLTVIKGQPTFSGLTASQTITYGTASVMVQGVLSVPLGETVSIDLGVAGHVTTVTTGDGGSFQAILPTSDLAAAVYTIKYTYAGNANFNGASDTSTTLTVTKAPATFSGLTVSQTITYSTPTIMVQGALNVPAGEIVSIDFGNAGHLVTARTVAGGSFQATLLTSDLPAGAYGIRYTYLGDSNFSGTTDTSTTLTVIKAQPTFSGLTAAPNALYGDASVLLYGVLSAAPRVGPAGETVSIDLGSTGHAVTATTILGGYFQVNLPTSDLPVGTYGIRYMYLGSSNLTPANDNSTTLTVIKSQPTFSGLIAAPSATYGDASVVLQGVLGRGSVPVPAGETVSIDLGKSGHAVKATTGNGGSFQANLPTSDLPVASYGIRYTYLGDSNFTGTTDTSTTLTVNKAQPTFSGLAASQTIVQGTPTAILTGILNAGSSLPVPAGETVSVTGSGNVVTATTTTNGHFQAFLPETDLGAASYQIGFSYLGDSNFLGSSAMLTITEPPAQTSTSVGASVNPADLGRPSTITASVTNIQGHLTPTGAVQFLVDGKPIGLVPLVNGSATISIGPYSVPGTHNITASYQPTSTFVTSTGTLALPVIRNLLVVITPPPASVLYGTNPFVFLVNYANVGADASTAILTETLPANVTFNAVASDPRWTNVGHGHFTINLGALNPGDSGTVSFAVNLPKKTAVVIDMAAIEFDAQSPLQVSTSTVSTKVMFGRRFGN